ncbi:MAG: hypothetical protein IJY58_00840 [Alphaproteobacteria bacterium]|nr:hypothetical protein [Alphaproteobacteria bacterium]
MKKLLLILALTVVLPSMAYAKCDGSTEIEGKNKHVYCLSDKPMNWWSAFAWCKANERPLATMAQACNNQNWVEKCSNIAIGKDQSVWLSIAFEDNKAYIINRFYGLTAKHERTATYSQALCY